MIDQCLPNSKALQKIDKAHGQQCVSSDAKIFFCEQTSQNDGAYQDHYFGAINRNIHPDRSVDGCPY